MTVGHLRPHTLSSKLLSKTPLKTERSRTCLVYEPHKLQQLDNPPVIFYLPGFGSNPSRWSQKDFPMHRLLDLLIAEGSLPPCIVVCIDGSTALGGSQYVDSVANGAFAQHIVEELIPSIEKTYKVKGPHLIAGHSSGGFGSLHLASLYPKAFKGLASFAGDLYFELTHKSMLGSFVNDMRLGKLGNNMKDVLDQSITHYVLGLCAAYSPNLKNKTWKVDFPIDPQTATIDEKVWKTWLSFDPMHWSIARLKRLKKLETVYLSAGCKDEFQLHLGAEAFVHRCRQHGVQAEYEAFDGTHSLLFRQMEAGFKALLQA